MPDHKRVSVIDQRDLPNDVPVTLSATTSREEITAEHPARLRIVFENTDKNPRTFSFGTNPPFTPKLSQTQSPGLMLLPLDTRYDPVTESCWQPTISDDTEYVVPSVLNQVTLDAGESIATELDVWGSYRNDDDICVPIGEYQFEESYGDFTWNFTVAVLGNT